MNYETATNEDLEVKLGELCGMGRFAEFTAPRYCTNWSATMPLAIKYGLEIDFDDYTNEYSVRFRGRWQYGEIAKPHNVLRAVVICLIKKLEQPR